MTAAWELVLHHTYTGTPRVIFDDSPRRQCHGVAINLANSDFLPDGATPGSGAVRFHPTSMVRVPATQMLNEAFSVRVEVTFVCDAIEGGPLVVGDSFGFGVENGQIFAGWSDAAGSFGGYTAQVGGPPVPVGQWVTAGYFYDGVLNHGFTRDGAAISSFRKALQPLRPPGAIRIGNWDVGQQGNPTVRTGFAGRIDDVKVWRLNPHYPDAVFQDRPTDSDCWQQYWRALNDALRADPECTPQLSDRIARALAGVMHASANNSDIAEQWQIAAQRYREFWQADQLDQIVPVLVDMVGALRQAGLDPTNDADFLALLHDPCLEKIRQQLPSLDCDPKFKSLLEHLEISL